MHYQLICKPLVSQSRHKKVAPQTQARKTRERRKKKRKEDQKECLSISLLLPTGEHIAWSRNLSDQKFHDFGRTRIIATRANAIARAMLILRMEILSPWKGSPDITKKYITSMQYTLDRCVNLFNRRVEWEVNNVRAGNRKQKKCKQGPKLKANGTNYQVALVIHGALAGAT